MGKLEVLYNGTTYIEDLVSSVELTGDIMQAARKLTVTFTNTRDRVTRLVDIGLGKTIKLSFDGKEMFRGYVFATNLNSDGDQEITAYDAAIYLTNNADDKKYSSKQASDIVKSLCKDFGIATGTVTATGYVLPRQLYKGKTLWDMMITALTETKRKTGRKYWIHFKGGKLHLERRIDAVSKYILAEGENIYTVDFRRSIEEMRNKIVIAKGDISKGQTRVVAKNDSHIKAYGLMQHFENVADDTTKTEMQEEANRLLKDKSKVEEEVTITCVGVPEIYSGMSVYVRNDLTKVLGGYYVQQDTHTFSASGEYTMTLMVKKTDDLPELEYDEPAESSKKKSGSGTGSSSNKTTAKTPAEDQVLRYEDYGMK